MGRITKNHKPGALNPFAVFGLRADDFVLTQYGAGLHFKRAVKHLFERGEAGALTIGPRVPLLKHLNVAKVMDYQHHLETRLDALEKTRDALLRENGIYQERVRVLLHQLNTALKGEAKQDWTGI